MMDDFLGKYIKQYYTGAPESISQWVSVGSSGRILTRITATNNVM